MDTNALPPSDINRALAAVGELLAAGGHKLGIVVVGGTALNLLGVVHRATRDVDVLAVASRGRGPERAIQPPTPLPAALQEAVATVARDLGLAPDWLNTGVASQWETGLPPGLEGRIHWRTYGGLPLTSRIWNRLSAHTTRTICIAYSKHFVATHLFGHAPRSTRQRAA